ncbi:MAG: metalloregulator ArsR/SmtB family transcription factor [Bacteroidota bacterium]
MKKVTIDGKLCVGPTFTKAEMAVIRQNLAEKASLPYLAELLAAVGNGVRLRIMYLLTAHREMCVCDLAEVLGMKVSAVSQHLRKLKDKQLVQNRRDGQTIYYTLKNNAFNRKLKRFIDVQQEVHELIY